MKVEILHTENISELDKLINSCIEQREIIDIKLTTTFTDDKKQYIALIMFRQ